jgi:glycosyltransferase involved in cell wall biosynthesis
MGKNLFVAPNGVDMPAKTKTAFRTDETHFVYIGRILPFIKGLDLMIQAFALEKDFLRQHGCRLDIYGPTEDRGVSFIPEMQSYISQGGVEELVSLHPAVVREEKRRVLLDADVFIQTSRTEGMPMGILEALSYGLPCLVTEGTTFAQTIKGSGAGWNGGTSAKTIAEALCLAVNSRSRFGEMSANAVRMAEAYSWNSAAATAIGHYRECIKER